MRKAIKLRDWSKENSVGLTKCYEEVASGQLEVVYIGRTPYVTEHASEKYWSSLKKKPLRVA